MNFYWSKFLFRVVDCFIAIKPERSLRIFSYCAWRTQLPCNYAASSDSEIPTYLLTKKYTSACATLMAVGYSFCSPCSSCEWHFENVAHFLCSLRCLIYFIFHCSRAVYLHVDSIADEFATYIAITPACLPHGSPTVKVHNKIW